MRLDLLRQAEGLFLGEPPVVLIYWYTQGYLMQPSVKNWNPLVLGNHNHNYKFIDLEPTKTAPRK